MFKHHSKDMSTAGIEYRNTMQDCDAEIKVLRRKIKRCKMMKRRAKLTYKISTKY